MKSDNYPKLVRDFIPGIIEEATGKMPNFCILEGNEVGEYLIKKLVEEIEEFEQADSIQNKKEEIADILEVLDAILMAENWSIDEIKILQAKKRAQRGGFEEGVLLLDNN